MLILSEDAQCVSGPSIRAHSRRGGLGSPQAQAVGRVGLEAPPRVVIHSGGERIGMRDGWGISNAGTVQLLYVDLDAE